MKNTSTAADIEAFFEACGKTVLTFLGFSGASYERPDAMLDAAAGMLDRHDPAATIVNIGATPDGIGAVYELAKQRGFETTGVVSAQALDAEVAPSSHADHVFYVEDETWGGYLDDGRTLSPTSEAMVSISDIIIAIGGGKVARDELLEARRRSKTITFIPAEMNHAKAIEKAERKEETPPTEFRGAAEIALAGRMKP